MNDFTASNGLRIEVNRSDPSRVAVVNAGGHLESLLTPDRMQALREFFQAEADESLGIWRSSDDPDVMVFKIDDDTIRLLHLRNRGVSTTFARYDQDGKGPLSAIARAYFDAHPEPKPWHDAKPGEVWVFTTPEGTAPAFVEARRGASGPVLTFDSATTEYAVMDSDVTAGRRLWPEVS